MSWLATGVVRSWVDGRSAIRGGAQKRFVGERLTGEEEGSSSYRQPRQEPCECVPADAEGMAHGPFASRADQSDEEVALVRKEVALDLHAHGRVAGALRGACACRACWGAGTCLEVRLPHVDCSSVNPTHRTSVV